jgi:hypothetical protein
MRKYVVPQGKHSSKGLRILPRRPMSFAFKVTESFRHPDSALSVSKIFGYADGWHHHQNSFRVGIRYNPGADNVDIYAYYYNNGTRRANVIGSCDFDELVVMKMSWTKELYALEFNGRWIYFNREGCMRTYPLFPYYGGQVPAPRDVIIFLDTF